ncbi:MAG: hypothetical protein QM743_13355 [Chitinophagaceae bacterium]
MEQGDQELLNLLNWDEREVSVLTNNLGFLKSLNIDMIQNIFLGYLHKSPLFRYTIHDRVIRGRLNENDEDFHLVSEMSYNTASPERIKMGRFNRDKQPMFYGTIPNGSKLSNPGVTSCIESLPEIVSEDGIHGYRDFTVGIWKVESPFDVVDLTFDNDERNPFRKRIDELIINQVVSSSQEQVSKIIFDFWTYVSELCSNKSISQLDYLLSNYLFDSINTCGYKDLPKVKGLLYPSSRTDRMGTNVVLYPEVVDEHLKLDSVLVYRIFRRPNENTYDIHPICQPVKIAGSEFKINRFNDEEINQIYHKVTTYQTNLS